ncbi:MAG: cell envelope integrity protein TolA [Bacilli bacterium]
MNYTNREVVRRLKQYDMFLNSLSLTTDPVQRERICDQLDKIEKQILLETNSEYEEEYMLLMNQNTKYFEEEKARLRNLISLITDRRSYLEERKIKHKNITGSLVELTTFLGEDKLTTLKKRLKVIEKYEDNKAKQETLIKEMKVLDVKISEASRNVKANMRLNESLEHKMINLVEKALDKLKLYSLTERKSEIIKKYNSLKYALDMAKENLKSAKELGDAETILSCDSMLSEVTVEYSKYNEELNINKLIDIYDKQVSGYDELLEKRTCIDEILKNIIGSSLYLEIGEEINKQFNTIKLEKQDIKNYESLKEEREKKNKLLYEIEEENNSKDFKIVLEDLIKNEKLYREEQIRAAKKKEYQERQKKLIEEQKIEASRVRRQKLIEEARLKDQQERAEKLKELQEKTVINPRKIDINSAKDDRKIEEVSKVEDNTIFENSFDTDELFENTKIVPNRLEDNENKEKINSQGSLKDDNVLHVNTSLEKKEEKLKESPIWTPPIWENDIKEEEKMPDIMDLFKEERKNKKDIDVEINEDNDDVSTNIYDVIEKNNNIIWKTTETKNDVNSIPVIGNNNLKPEILDNKKKEDIAFPNIDNKEGEILWKETL